MELEILDNVLFDGPLVKVDVINRDTQQKVTVDALLDTGASRTCVRYEKVLQTLGVKQLGKANLTHLQSEQKEENESYLVDIGMHGPPKGVYTWEKVTVIRKDLLDAPYDVVVGRDMLERCLFNYNGRNKTFELFVPS